VERFTLAAMLKLSNRGHRRATSLWIAFVLFLLGLNGALALIVVRFVVWQPAAAQQTPTITSTATPQPQHTAVARLPTTTRRPTRTPRPRATPIPTRVGQSLIATPAIDPPPCTATTGFVTDEIFQSRISGNAQPYIVYLPPCYDSTSVRYPTLYLIHGASYDETHWESLGVFKAMDAGIQARRWLPAIIVLPDGDEDLFTNTSGGPGSYEAQFVQELVPIIDGVFRTDPRPQMRAIGGISRGGVWSLEIAFHNPSIFGIVGGHSACLNLNEAPPELDPLKMVDLPTLKTQRIWLDTGDADGCRAGVDELHDALSNAGVTHEYRLWPGGHEDAVWAAHIEDDLAFYTQSWPKSQ